LPRGEFRQPGYDRVGGEEGFGGAGHGEAWSGGLGLTTKGTESTKGFTKRTRRREPPRHDGTKESKKKGREEKRREEEVSHGLTQMKHR
jgi:hypothetical protein